MDNLYTKIQFEIQLHFKVKISLSSILNMGPFFAIRSDMSKMNKSDPMEHMLPTYAGQHNKVGWTDKLMGRQTDGQTERQSPDDGKVIWVSVHFGRWLKKRNIFSPQLLKGNAKVCHKCYFYTWVKFTHFQIFETVFFLYSCISSHFCQKLRSRLLLNFVLHVMFSIWWCWGKSLKKRIFVSA